MDPRDEGDAVDRAFCMKRAAVVTVRQAIASLSELTGLFCAMRDVFDLEAFQSFQMFGAMAENSSPARMPGLVVFPRRQHLRGDQFDEIARLRRQVLSFSHHYAITARGEVFRQ